MSSLSEPSYLYDPLIVLYLTILLSEELDKNFLISAILIDNFDVEVENHSFCEMMTLVSNQRITHSVKGRKCTTLNWYHMQPTQIIYNNGSF